MAEPTARAETIEQPLPGLWHWSLEDDRLGGARSHAYALATASGLVLIDPLPALNEPWTDVVAVVMTHGNHQRSCWRLRREHGAPVHAPVGVTGLDEEPDRLLSDGDSLHGLQAIRGRGFQDACYLVDADPSGARRLFCGDLICHSPGGPYRFPVQPDYFDLQGGRADALRLLELEPTALFAAHAEPSLEGAVSALRGALDRAES